MRLTRDEIVANRARLSEWHTPAEMQSKVEHLMDHLGCGDLFNQSGLEFIREAWVAVQIGNKRGASMVRLVQDERPDFTLRFDGGGAETYEVVEADVQDRRRGLECRTCGVKHFPVEEWATGKQAADVIRSAAPKKAKTAQELAEASMPYPPGTRLLVNLNLGDFRGGMTKSSPRSRRQSP
jgi:hypothetical protein